MQNIPWFFHDISARPDTSRERADSFGMPRDDSRGGAVSSDSGRYSQGVLTDHLHNLDNEIEAQSSFFSYFVLMALVCIIMYLMFHNKQKVRFF